MSAPTGPAAGDSRVVYFGNLDRKVTDEQLKAFAATAGRVETVAHLHNFAYVTYSSEADANSAISKLTGQTLGDREVRVEKSRSEEERAARKEERPARKPRAKATTTTSPAGGAGSPSEPAKVHDNKVIVKGLPREMDAEAAKKAFGTCGVITKCRIGGGLARITFETVEAADKAVGLTETNVGERVIRVEKERVRRRARKSPVAAAGPGAKKSVKTTNATSAKVTREPREAREPREPRRVRVDGLVEGTSADQLKTLFASCGRVLNAKVIAGRNHGFVTFEEPADANKAVGLNGSTLGSAPVTVALDVRTRRTREGAEADAGAGRRRTAGEEEREPRDLTATVFVGGLDTTKADEAVVRKAFGAYGSIASVEFISGKRSAYVKFTSDAAVSAAVAGLQDKQPEFAIRPLRVESATGPSTAARRPRRRAPRARRAPASE